MEKPLSYCGKRASICSKKAGRIAAEGIVDSYIHGGGRIGVWLKLIARRISARLTSLRLWSDIAMHIAATNPQYVQGPDSQEILEKRKRSRAKQ